MQEALHDPRHQLHVRQHPPYSGVKREFVTAKGNGSHISLLRLLRTGLTVAQVERYLEDEVQKHYLKMKDKYIELWDKVWYLLLLFTAIYLSL